MCPLGHKRTFAVQRLMSALPPKADMCSATRDVRYGQKRTLALQQAHFTSSAAALGSSGP